MTLATQDEAIARLRDPTVHEIASGHLPMLTNADELGEIIARTIKG